MCHNSKIISSSNETWQQRRYSKRFLENQDENLYSTTHLWFASHHLPSSWFRSCEVRKQNRNLHIRHNIVRRPRTSNGLISRSLKDFDAPCRSRLSNLTLDLFCHGIVSLANRGYEMRNTSIRNPCTYRYYYAVNNDFSIRYPFTERVHRGYWTERGEMILNKWKYCWRCPYQARRRKSHLSSVPQFSLIRKAVNLTEMDCYRSKRDFHRIPKLRRAESDN